MRDLTEDPRPDRELWDDKAAAWDVHIGDEGDRNRRYHVHPVLWRMLGDVSGLDVLDAGCGTGYLVVELARRGARVTGLDFSEAMVAVARGRVADADVQAALGVADCSRFDALPRAQFDRLVSVYVLQDLPDLAGAARSFRRVLRPGGQAVVVFGHPCFGVPGGPQSDEGRTSYHWPFPYFDEVRCEETWRGRDATSGERFDFPSPFTFYHRPLRAYWRAFANAELRVLDFDEPVLRPPYPPDLSATQIAELRRYPWSVAFHLEAT